MKLISERITKGIRQLINAHIFNSLLLLTIGGIFIVSGVSKIFSDYNFTNIVLSYNLLPEALGRLYASILPWAEIIVGVLLIMPLVRIATRIASLISILIILSFLIANSYIMFSGNNIWDNSCGCFGEALPMSHTGSLTLGVVMLLVTTFLFIREIWPLDPRPSLPRPKLFGALLLTVLAVSAIAFTYISNPTTEGNTNGIHEAEAISHIQNEITSEIDTSLANNIPVFMFFYAEGCPYCAQQAPIVDELQEELGDNITFIRVNFEQYREMAEEFKVKVTPTMLLLHDKNAEGVYKYLIFNNLTTKETLLDNMADYLPADTTVPVISDITISGVQDTTATISWVTNESATSDIEYGPDTGYGYSFPSISDTAADKTSHSLTLSGLSPETEYHFKIKSTDNAGNEAVSGDNNFTTNADTTAPEISDVTFSDVTETTATISWTTDEPATGNIEYGPDAGYGYSYPSPSDTTADKTSHSLTISGLSPDIAYHFRIKSADNAGNEAVSGDHNFTLNTTPDTTAPVISDITMSDITDNTATISWTTDEPATGNLEYGPDTGYGYSFPSPSDTTADKFSHSLTISGLSPETEYHFKIKSADNAGNEAVSIYSLNTTQVFAVRTEQATYVNSPDGVKYIANVNGYLVSLGNATSVSVYFQFGTDTNYDPIYDHRTPVTMTAAGSFTSIFGTNYFYDPTLDANTTYHFRAVAKMADGTTVYGDDLTFFTEPYPNPSGQIVQSITLEQAHSMYVARSDEEDFVILQNESYHEGILQIVGTDMNLSPWCAACLAELQSLDRNKTYLLYAGDGTSGITAYNAEVMSDYMKNMGFMNVYFMTPATVSDWAAAGYPTP